MCLGELLGVAAPAPGRRLSARCSPPASPNFTPTPPATAPPQVRSPPRTSRRSVLVQKHLDCRSLDEKYTVVRRLGSGSFGCVDLVRNSATGEERVCKTVKTQGMSKATLAIIMREIQVLSALDHPHIVKLYEHAEDKESGTIKLILEYLPRGDFGSMLAKDGHLPEHAVAHVVRHLLVALSYCHGHGVVHRDIKPANMMVASSRLDRPDCKVIDFGLAGCTAFDDNAPMGSEGEDGGNGGGRKERIVASRRVGTPAYMAPEVFTCSSALASKADMWSVGVTALELITGRHLFKSGTSRSVGSQIRGFKGAEDVTARVGMTDGWKQLSDAGRRFVLSLLEVDPERRPSASEALAHAWLHRKASEVAALPRNIALSLTAYTRAKPVVRQCLHVIASCTSSAEEFESAAAAAFMHADADGSGRVDLHSVIHRADDAAGDLSPRSPRSPSPALSVNYTELLAACLHGKFTSVRDLAAAAFSALDADGDGRVEGRDVRRVFGGDCGLSLSPDKAFSADEFIAAVSSVAGSPRHVSKLRLCVAGARYLTG